MGYDEGLEILMPREGCIDDQTLIAGVGGLALCVVCFSGMSSNEPTENFAHL